MGFIERLRIYRQKEKCVEEKIDTQEEAFGYVSCEDMKDFRIARGLMGGSSRVTTIEEFDIYSSNENDLQRSCSTLYIKITATSRERSRMIGIVKEMQETRIKNTRELALKTKI